MKLWVKMRNYIQKRKNMCNFDTLKKVEKKNG